MSDYTVTTNTGSIPLDTSPPDRWVRRVSLHSNKFEAGEEPTEANRVADVTSTWVESLPGGRTRHTWTFAMLPGHGGPQIITVAYWDQDLALWIQSPLPSTGGTPVVSWDEQEMPLMEEDHGQTWLSPVRDVSPAHPDASA